MPTHRYFGHGIDIESPIPLPELPVLTSPGSNPDAWVKVGKTPSYLDNATRVGPFFQSTSTDYLLTIPHIARFHVQRGQLITVESFNNLHGNTLGLFLTGAPLAMLIRQRGGLVFNGGAFLSDHGAVILAGRSGVGKSTLLAALAKEGLTILTDEICALDLDGGKPRLWPGNQACHIWADTRDQLQLHPGSVDQLRQNIEKYRYQPTTPVLFEKSVPVDRIVAMRVRHHGRAELSALQGIAKLKFLENLLQEYPHHGIAKMDIRVLSELAQKINAHTLTHSKSFALRQLKRLVESSNQKLCTSSLPNSKPEPTTTVATENKKSITVINSASGHQDQGGGLHRNLVWLASYPKSGNTWLRIFLANYLAQHDSSININELGDNQFVGLHAAQRHLFDSCTGIRSSFLSHNEIQNYRPQAYREYSRLLQKRNQHTCFIKIHDALTSSDNGNLLIPADVTRVAIYIVRNPLDVVVSYSRHFNLDIDTCIRLMRSEANGLCSSHTSLENQLKQSLSSWHSHVTSWTSNNSNLRVKAVRYEDMKADPLSTFTNILEFSQLPIDEAAVLQAVNNSDFNVMQSQEIERGFDENVSTVSFFRSGHACSWKRYLSAAQADLIIDIHGHTMALFGYV